MAAFNFFLLINLTLYSLRYSAEKINSFIQDWIGVTKFCKSFLTTPGKGFSITKYQELCTIRYNTSPRWVILEQWILTVNCAFSRREAEQSRGGGHELAVRLTLHHVFFKILLNNNSKRTRFIDWYGNGKFEVIGAILRCHFPLCVRLPSLVIGSGALLLSSSRLRPASESVAWWTWYVQARLVAEALGRALPECICQVNNEFTKGHLD